jgi:urease accessory protein
METIALGGAAQAFAYGLLHPLLAPAHIVALIGLGLVAGGAEVSIVIAFAAGLAGGLDAIASGIGETPATDALLALAALCGMAAAARLRIRAGLAAPAALGVGIALGLDSPPEFISLGEAVAALIGTACGGVLALTLIALAAASLARLWQGIALRVAGSWIAAIAILVLALRLAG